MADLTTLDNVKAYLGLEAGQTADDVLLSRLITAASDFITKATDRVWVPTEITETQNGSGGMTIFPRQYPVISVESVTVDGATIPARSTVTGEGWVLSDDAIRLVGYVASPGVENVEIVYEAGFASVPTEIEQATIEIVAWRFREKERIGQLSTTNAGVQVQYLRDAYPPSVEPVINAYRRPGVA